MSISAWASALCAYRVRVVRGARKGGKQRSHQGERLQALSGDRTLPAPPRRAQTPFPVFSERLEDKKGGWKTQRTEGAPADAMHRSTAASGGANPRAATRTLERRASSALMAAAPTAALTRTAAAA